MSRLILALSLLAAACGGPTADVVLYCAVDQTHSEPIVRAFEAATGLVVDFRPDVELSKSVGHRRVIQEEAGNPRCDVFWNNEVVQTVLLAEHDLLEPYDSPSAADIPANYRDPDGFWTGFGARGRVLIVNTETFPDADTRPATSASFLDAALKGRAGMARPLTGTTAAHASYWIWSWGAERTFAFLQAMQDNDVRFGPGNAHLMRLVRQGDLDFGWTDTDDVKAAVDQGFPVARIVPDQGGSGPGLLVIPNTVSLVKGAPHPEAARRLIDYLLSREVEERLARGPSGQIPVRDGVPRPDDVLDLGAYDVADVDWNAVGRTYAEHADALEAHFNR